MPLNCSLVFFMLHHLLVLPVCCIIHKQNRYKKKPRTTNVAKIATKDWCNMEQSFSYMCDGVLLVPARLKRNKKRGETFMKDPEWVSLSTHCIQTALIHRGIAAQSFQMNLFQAFVYHTRNYWIVLCWINRHRFVYLQDKDYQNKMSMTNNA